MEEVETEEKNELKKENDNINSAYYIDSNYTYLNKNYLSYNA